MAHWYLLDVRKVLEATMAANAGAFTVPLGPLLRPSRIVLAAQHAVDSWDALLGRKRKPRRLDDV